MAKTNMPGTATSRGRRLTAMIAGRDQPEKRFVVPLVAAALVLAVLVGGTAGWWLLRPNGRSLGPARHGHSRPVPSQADRAAPSASLSPVPENALHSQPRYLVTSVQAHAAIRSASTGKVVARVKAPEHYFHTCGLAMAPGDRAFYIAGQVPIASSGRMWIDFYRVPLNRDGHPGPAQRLPGERLNVPGAVTSDALIQLPLAVSADGTELAYPSANQFYWDNYAASHPAAVTVQNVLTGARRTWAIWPALDTQISSVSWGSGGRLGIIATIGDANVVNGRLHRHPHTDVHVFLVLDTAAPGSSLYADASVVASSSYRPVDHGQLRFVTMGPTGGVISPDGTSAYLQIGLAHGTAELAQVAVPTGRVLRILLARPAEPTQASPQAIDARYLLVALGPDVPPKPRGSYVCGRLTALNLVTGSVNELPFPIQCSTEAPPPPVQSAW
ncbi:MAG: hypothetical protein ACTHJW_02945 [Streptosporangiaceae bacterium]